MVMVINNTKATTMTTTTLTTTKITILKKIYNIKKKKKKDIRTIKHRFFKFVFITLIFVLYEKNPAYGRQRISRPMWIVAPMP